MNPRYIIQSKTDVDILAFEAPPPTKETITYGFPKWCISICPIWKVKHQREKP